MTYDIQIDGHGFVVEIEREGEGWRVRVDGEAVAVESAVIAGGTLSLLLGTATCTFQVERQSSDNGAAHWRLGHRGRQVTAEVRDRRRLRRDAHGVAQEGRVRLTTPMAGKVVKLLARPGDAVEAGQGLLVLEAMKMQNEVRSPKRGVLLALAVTENSTVATGQLLCEIE